MKYVLITGVSRGLGKALAKAFLYASYGVIGISRTCDPELEEEAKKNGKPFTFLPWDLTNIEYLEDLVSQILSIFPKECEELVFIHNAGEMQPVTEIKNLTASDILHNFLLNTISPIALTSAFVRKFFPTSFPLQMIFISSRSVITPRKLWAVYGAAKASIDHFAKSLALEYKRKKSFHVLVIHPPAMETEMRKQYLKKRSWFFWLWDWISIHILRQKKVYHPDLVAWKILYLIEKKSLPSGTVWKWE